MKTQLSVLFVFFLFHSIVWSQTVIVSTFDTDNEGWTVNGGIMHYQGLDGNPNGFIEFEDDQDGAGVFIAPEKFLGNLSSYDQGMLEFDLKNTINNEQEMLNGYGKVRITSSNNFAEKNVVPLAYIDNWTTFSIPLNSEVWGLSLEGWDSLLAEVTEIYIQVDAQWNYYDRTGLDNFKISPNINGIDYKEKVTILHQVYPNPFTTSTTIKYELQHPETVRIEFYSQLGKLVDVIEQEKSAGKQQLVWNAEGLPAGVYFCKVKSRQGTQTTKLIKL